MIAKRLLRAVALGVSLVWAGFAAAAPLPPEGRVTLQQLRDKYAEPGSAYVDLLGVNVYYKDEGKGPAILMIHGSSSSLKTYDRIAEKLKDRYRIIRYDIPPNGLSGPVSDVVIKAGTHAEDLPEALLTKLGVQHATVVGVSSGGSIAYFFAAKRPDMVDRLIISNAPADPVDTSHMVLSKALTDEMRLSGQQQYTAMTPVNGAYKRRQYWKAYLDFYLGEPDRVTPDMVEQFYDFNRRENEKNPTAFIDMVEDHPHVLEVGVKVVCPILLVWGERDPLLTAHSLDAIASYFPHADISRLKLPDVGHYPPLEIPDRFADIIAAYIEGVTPVKPTAPPPADR